MTDGAYFDAQGAVPMDEEVLETMVPYFKERFGNPSSLHELGRQASAAVEEAREKVAGLLNAKPREVVFTSGATESLNLAINGILSASQGGTVVTSVIEHPAVTQTLKKWENRGFAIIEVKVNEEGLLNMDELKNSLEGEDVVLAAIQHGNQEIGVVQDLERVGRMTAERGVPLLVDATATAGKLPLDVRRLNIDVLAFSGSDLYGPKGTGVLFVKLGRKLADAPGGGGQEKGIRPGTENVPGVVGLGTAVELVKSRMEEDNASMIDMRDRIIDAVLESIPKSYLNGSRKKRLPNNAHFRFDYIEGESLLLNLDMVGIKAATGSACSSKTLEPSKVLLSLGLSHEQSHGSLQVTLSRHTTEEEVNYLLEELPGVVQRLRKMSPLYVED